VFGLETFVDVKLRCVAVNEPPLVNGARSRKLTKQLGLGKKTFFSFQVYDPDIPFWEFKKKLKVSVIGKQRKYFQLKRLNDNGKGGLSFLGSWRPGTYTAQVRVSDGEQSSTFTVHADVACGKVGFGCKFGGCCLGFRCTGRGTKRRCRK